MSFTNSKQISSIHPTLAQIAAITASSVDAVIVYLADSKQSGASLGMATANDPTFIAGLMRGTVYTPSRMMTLFQYIADFYTAQLAREADTLPIAV